MICDTRPYLDIQKFYQLSRRMQQVQHHSLHCGRRQDDIKNTKYNLLCCWVLFILHDLDVMNIELSSPHLSSVCMKIISARLSVWCSKTDLIKHNKWKYGDKRDYCFNGATKLMILLSEFRTVTVELRQNHDLLPSSFAILH